VFDLAKQMNTALGTLIAAFVVRERLGKRRPRFTDAQRRHLAFQGRALGRRGLDQLAGLVTPNTILRWYDSYALRGTDGTDRDHSDESPLAEMEGTRPIDRRGLRSLASVCTVAIG
jgi:hypothetical protein